MSLLLIGWTFALVTLILAGTKQITWLDFLYYCSYIKLAVTLTKYVPQVRSHIAHLTAAVVSLSSLSGQALGGGLLGSGHFFFFSGL